MLLLLALLLAAGRLYFRYRRDLQAARQRLQALDSRVLSSGCGPIEYTTYGTGFPILVAHGIFGGLDQGLVLARGQVGQEFLSIVPSRFGYLRTPLPPGATPAQQADAFVCLLDELGLPRAAVLGTSAGGTAAIQFALRHPQRCAALILVSSNAPGQVEVGLLPRPLANILFRSDLIFWLLITYFPASMQSIMGVPAGFELTAAQQRDMQQVMETLLPVSPRAEGALFDMYISNPDINRDYPLQDIQAPTLVLHAQDDPLAKFENTRRLAARIPQARLVVFDRGGHPLLGHEDQVRQEITGFLQQQALRPGHSRTPAGAPAPPQP